MKRQSQKVRFRKFVKDLERISTENGIAIQSVGGVYIFDGPIKITYHKDHTSGDLLPSWDE
ncbi:MAG: hypothetical protein CMP48_17465 [Rickettsiales bacterium]|nr:hypothetical protein [Rickettsiales bacterium]